MENKRTCLYDKHVALGALMSPFGGFDMPIQYSGIVDEHQAVRTACGVFDVSHMGEVLITGRDAERYVNHIFTNDVAGMPDGKILYGMMCGYRNRLRAMMCSWNTRATSTENWLSRDLMLNRL